MPKQSIVAVGNTFRIYDDSVKVHNKLPLGTYRVEFSQMSGHSLSRIENMEVPSEKMYGRGQKRIDAILTGYAAMQRSYGVLASGAGGMGKTMLMRSLAAQASDRFKLPVVVVDQASPGLAQYIGSIGEAIIFFDEFEKIFVSDDEFDNQVQFLSLFDGLGTAKQMYLATVNDLNRVNSYMVNRTGRFHKHLRFDYPGSSEIREYLTDHGVKKKQIEKVVRFATRVPLNYDHLRSIAFELTTVGESFEDAIGDLNIKSLSVPSYQIVAVFEKATLRTTQGLDLFGTQPIHFWVSNTLADCSVQFDPSSVIEDNSALKMVVDASDVTVNNLTKAEKKAVGELRRIELTQSFARDIDYVL